MYQRRQMHHLNDGSDCDMGIIDLAEGLCRQRYQGGPQMFTVTGQAIHKQFSTDESGEPPL
jgi:hypothetical protein